MSNRWDRVRHVMSERGLDALLITSPANRFFLSGYTADGPVAADGAVVVDRNQVTVFTNANNTGWATATVQPDVVVETWERPWEPWLAAHLAKTGVATIGIEDQNLTLASFNALQVQPASLSYLPVGDAIDHLRMVKDTDELARISAAVALNDAVFVAATTDLTAGITERELAWRIDREMRERGGDGNAFPTIVASGPNAANPHHEPTDRQLQPGEPVIIDMGVRLQGYMSDLTRTVWIGEPTPKLREVYTVVAAANAAAAAAIRPDMTSAEGDDTARSVITAAGFGDQFGHGLGHGIGVDIHEAPFMGKTYEHTIPIGSVITIEPGIYLPGWGGVRIEDVGVIEASGARILTQAPKLQP